MPRLAEYFVHKGVVATASPEAAPAEPSTRDDLHYELARFACTGRCPPILRYIIPGPGGELFACAPHYLKRDRREICERLESEHAQHLASLADFGDKAEEVCRSIELGVLCLMPDPADYPSPSPMAAAIRIGAALEEDLRDLREQSAKMTSVEKLTAR